MPRVRQAGEEIKTGQAAVVKRQKTTPAKFCLLIRSTHLLKTHMYVKIVNYTDHFCVTGLNCAGGFDDVTGEALFFFYLFHNISYFRPVDKQCPKHLCKLAHI